MPIAILNNYSSFNSISFWFYFVFAFLFYDYEEVLSIFYALFKGSGYFYGSVEDFGEGFCSAWLGFCYLSELKWARKYGYLMEGVEKILALWRIVLLMILILVLHPRELNANNMFNFLINLILIM